MEKLERIWACAVRCDEHHRHHHSYYKELGGKEEEAKVPLRSAVQAVLLLGKNGPSQALEAGLCFSNVLSTSVHCIPGQMRCVKL